MERQIQAVIFDMYETLVTQFCSPLYYGTQIARDLGLAPEEFLPGWRATEFDRATGKLTLESVVEMLMKEHGVYSAEKFRQVVDKRLAIQADCFGHLHPQILPMLSGLKAQGIKIGLITNCFSEEARLIRESQLFPYFDAPCLSYELGMRKPDPAVFLSCVEKLGIPAGRCLYVGDGGSQELETARDVGMQVVQATWYRRDGFESYQAAIRPEFMQVSQPMKLLEVLNTWQKGASTMKKYAISREFFPWNLFAPPISEKFLAMAVPHMKPPKSLWRDKALDVTTHEITCHDGGKISCFVLSPRSLPANAPCLIYLHGGGFVLEAAGYHYTNAMRYAKEVGCKVVFPQYRLAPRYAHPVFFEDCYAAFCWAYDHAEELGIDIQRMGIGGDSAGATLAVGVCMMARERQHPVRFRFQMLPYPYLDARGSSESCKRFTDTPMWNSSLSDRIGPMTRVDRERPDYVLYSPVEGSNFEGLPPAYIETAEFDCLHDDGILYAGLLRGAGIEVTLNETRGTMHGFDIATKAPTTLAAMEQRIAFMKRRLA